MVASSLMGSTEHKVLQVEQWRHAKCKVRARHQLSILPSQKYYRSPNIDQHHSFIDQLHGAQICTNIIVDNKYGIKDRVDEETPQYAL